MYSGRWIGGFMAAPYLSSLERLAQPRFVEPGSGLHPEPGGSLPVGRVTVPTIYVYQQPFFSAARMKQLHRDDLFLVQNILEGVSGPAYNPTWYQRNEGGYVHSGRIQLIPPLPVNKILEQIPGEGVLGQVTIPITFSQRFTKQEGWQPLYRLYFESLHWIVGLEEGPDSTPWYRLRDTNPVIEYFAPASVFKAILPSVYSPLSPDIPAEEKRIRVNLGEQLLCAYEGERLVYQTKVSSGIHTENLDPGLLPTDTPPGVYHVQLKMPSRHMGDGRVTSDPSSYELPGVPWVMVFQKDGIALHGTYWHNNFGTPMSHGCVNLNNEAALWLFRWSDPVFSPGDWYVQGYGTLVQVM